MIRVEQFVRTWRRAPPAASLKRKTIAFYKRWSFFISDFRWSTNGLLFVQGDKMKLKDNKLRPQNEEERRQARRTVWMRVIAIFLAIVFLASECATLLPIE